VAEDRLAITLDGYQIAPGQADEGGSSSPASPVVASATVAASQDHQPSSRCAFSTRLGGSVDGAEGSIKDPQALEEAPRRLVLAQSPGRCKTGQNVQPAR